MIDCRVGHKKRFPGQLAKISRRYEWRDILNFYPCIFFLSFLGAAGSETEILMGKYISLFNYLQYQSFCWWPNCY
jgi:hypothetical protein